MRREGERTNGDAQGTDWLGRITGALWVGLPLLVLLQVAGPLPTVNGYSLVPLEALLAVVFLIVLSFRNHRRGHVSVLVEVGMGVVIAALLMWGAFLLLASVWGY